MFLHVWTRSKALWEAMLRPRSLKHRLFRILSAMLLVQLLFAGTLLTELLDTQHAMNRLIVDRMQPINDLQNVTDSFATALNSSQKVRSGTLSPQGGVALVIMARARAQRSWAQFQERRIDASHEALIDTVDSYRADADRATAQLIRLLRQDGRDRLDFFAAGDLYGAIDPLMSASRGLIDDLQNDALVEQRAMMWRFYRNLALSALLILAAAGVGFWGVRTARRGIAQPLAAVAEATRHIEDGAPGAPIAHLDRDDEIGDIARAIRFARERSAEARALMAEQEHIRRAATERELAEHRGRSARADALNRLFDSFERDFSRVTMALAGSSERMRDAAGSAAERARSAEDQAMNSAGLSEETAASIAHIAQNGQALAGAIEAVRGSVGELQSSAAQAAEHMGRTRVRTDMLDTLTDEIGNVLSLIGGITRQTKLLALNARIEAERAGPAGRGFTVVANEVKLLARAAEDAADEIAERLSHVRDATRDVSVGVRSIDAVIGKVDRSADQIVQSVHKQSAASRQIATAIAQVAAASNQAASSAHDLKDMAEAAHQHAEGLRTLADDVADQSGMLRAEVKALITQVKAC